MNSQPQTNGLNNMLQLRISVLVFQQGDYYVALCPALDLSSYGDSVEEAKVGFDEVMTSYLEDGKANGSLQIDLVKNGWQIIDDNQLLEPPVMVELDIPAGLLKTQYNEKWTVPVC